jgi:uncharacterized protein YqeY
MSLEARVQQELKEAMRQKQEGALRALRAIKSAILLAKTSGSGTPLAAEDEMKLLQKLAKQRRESIDIYKQQGRDDLANAESEELAVIENFLPGQLDDAALEEAVRAIIERTGAASPAELGKVMGIASKELAGRADNKRVAALVRRLLSA